jgi:hypothetical protein
MTEENARKIAHAIAFGHAYWKHATNVSESGELINESSFESLILETILNPSKSRGLERNRAAFWNASEGLLVIFDPRDVDLGTAYWPKSGANEYKNVR